MVDSDSDSDFGSDDVPTTDDGADLEVADPSDFFVTRSDGETPDPVKQRIPGTDQALRVRPLTNGHLERWGDALESDDPDEAVVAEVFSYALADLDGDVTAADVDQNMLGYGVAPVLQAIKNASGYQAFMGFREQRMRMLGMLSEIQESGLDLGDLTNLAEQSDALSDGTS